MNLLDPSPLHAEHLEAESFPLNLVAPPRDPAKQGHEQTGEGREVATLLARRHSEWQNLPQPVEGDRAGKDPASIGLFDGVAVGRTLGLTLATQLIANNPPQDVFRSDESFHRSVLVDDEGHGDCASPEVIERVECGEGLRDAWRSDEQ